MNGFRPVLRVLLSVAALGAGRAAHAQASRTMFPDSIKEVPISKGVRPGPMVTRTALGTDERSATVTFEVALRMRSFDELQARIAGGEQIAAPEMAAKYYPLSADHDRVVAWLKNQGLEVTRTDSNRLAVFGRGSVDAVSRAFQVDFARVADASGTEFTSAVSAPSLPSDVAPAVLGIHGLQPHIHRHPLSAPRSPQPRQTINVGPGYSPAQIATAYGAAGVSQTGTGQTIALYELAFPRSSDLTSFWSQNGINRTGGAVQMINIAGGPAASPSDMSSEEATLDVEWAGALAPGAGLRIYAASEDDPAYNDQILQQIFADLPNQPTLRELSISIGGNEAEVDHDYLIIEAQYMANLASAGVSIFVASGDNRAVVDGVLQTTYPTSDPDVTGVGGTSPTLDATGNVTLETAWPESGGGVSIVFNRPSWQTGTGVPAGAMRCVPDVAAIADPSPGASIVFKGSDVAVGGTSLATPIWAAFCALINQGRGTPIGLLNPKLYPLIGTNSLRDITSGNNGKYNAGVGYDLCTGVGVPVVSALLQLSQGSGTPFAIAGALGDRTVTLGQPATFFVAASGAGSLGYQWQRRPAGSSTFANLSDNATFQGSATAMLVVNGTSFAMTGDAFQCVVTGASGSITSAPEALTVNSTGVTTLAGWPGFAGSIDATGFAARFSIPGSVRPDAAGNIYVADSENDTIRKVTPAGVVTTVAGTPGQSGSTDGPAATALFNGTAGVAPDGAGDVFVADDGNFTIREISASGNVTTVAGLAGSSGEVDGTGASARFMDPQNLAIDGSGNLYVADGMGNTVRKVAPGGVVTTFAGSGVAGSADGTGTAAQFNDPTGITVDASGNVYVADDGNNTIRKITPAGVVTTIAGSAGTSGSVDGTGAAARFDGPAGIGVDSSGNLYVADANNDTIREIAPSGAVTTIAGSPGVEEGTDGLAANARFAVPGDVTVDAFGNIYVADAGNDTIRRIVPSVVSVAPASGSQLVDVSSRSLVGTGGAIAIAGFVVNGPAGSTKEVLIRGVGPALAPFGVTGVLAQPTISVVNASGTVLATNTGWSSGPDAPQVAAVSAQVGAFTLPQGSADSALTADVPPGAYTVELSGVGSTTGVGLVEVYDAQTSSPATLANISTRAQVGTGSGILIAGFVVTGSQPVTVLIRGIGPALSTFGVTGVLAQPVLTVYNSSSTAIAGNTGWGTAPNSAQIASVSASVGAFALTSGSADSALVLTLPPGAYSAQVAGAGGATGVALVEVYQVP